MKIITTGLLGFVGSRISEILGKKYEFTNISRSCGVNIKNRTQVLKYIENSDAPIVLHLAAKTNVDACQRDKDDTWAINVVGTQNIIDACDKTGKKIIYVSTDFVFDGEKEEELYTEEDIQNPINWYGKTKYEGEKIVQKSSVPWIIMRIAYPYRAQSEKKDFFRAMLSRLENGYGISAVTDHVMTPTFIDDIAHALDVLIQKNAEGLFHVVGGEHLSPFEAALSIGKTFKLNSNLITKTTREEYFKTNAPRPFKLALGNAKIGKLGIEMRSFTQGIEEIKRQTKNSNVTI
ncbi:MAG: hypothetical protein A3F31_03820 [Candidatus Levybacteria bacterium RIFCSPHIGHO2_12_FULL_38_12]|nr:MAG: hypothetical protein A2770_02215 [Candidatus Levybacteria bacterium RIFCSPHIGHO2_01_FULL_38_12]OGH21893.1 MAG: hypothetical protein A3D75_00435 [Candidatus Levybacteria bacterium RIFCSPHIGHO2_02_FULL_37_18]OGH22825.1 MAG: hypothetical protein A3F31_03820 [Candidatus Levybacteria bacterium RIFCSPHIGHO2_12_FULL_38_12]OGH33550.1 MAG: hypothetical protein A3A47_01780 [Candidatus Levybacteria bacterium RIFCSPLOWO2_01_FULL_37_20]OGH44471.1 MAG: hypothetical protein A3J14_03470 [Candidatus Lev